MHVILHIIAQTDWEKAQVHGIYNAPSLATEGFIHFSKPHQVARVANNVFAGRNDLILLVVDPARLTAELKYEPASGTYQPDRELFPHLYGSLNLDAVIRVMPFLPAQDGEFARPDLA
jgi:uncharacterized protein (DUF952 family)